MKTELHQSPGRAGKENDLDCWKWIVATVTKFLNLIYGIIRLPLPIIVKCHRPLDRPKDRPRWFVLKIFVAIPSTKNGMYARNRKLFYEGSPTLNVWFSIGHIEEQDGRKNFFRLFSPLPSFAMPIGDVETIPANKTKYRANHNTTMV
ncbi:Uncharacterised protein at_DN1876 [Pycnogonum litorale]